MLHRSPDHSLEGGSILGIGYPTVLWVFSITRLF